MALSSALLHDDQVIGVGDLNPPGRLVDIALLNRPAGFDEARELTDDDELDLVADAGGGERVIRDKKVVGPLHSGAGGSESRKIRYSSVWSTLGSRMITCSGISAGSPGATKISPILFSGKSAPGWLTIEGGKFSSGSNSIVLVAMHPLLEAEASSAAHEAK
jgi:hypothetical protein